MDALGRAVPYAAPHPFRQVFRRAVRVFAAKWQQYILVYLLAVLIPYALREFLWPVVFPRGVEFGEGVLRLFTSVWWNLGVKTSAAISLRVFEWYWSIGLIAGAGTLIAAAYLQGKTLSWRGLSRFILLRRGVQLLLAYFFAGLIVFGLLLFAIFGTFICIGIFGTPLIFFVLGGWVPFLAPVILLEDGPYSVRLARAWSLGRRAIWFNLGIVVVFVTLTAIINFFADRLFNADSQIFDLIQIAITFATWTFAVILFVITYYDARLRHDTEEIAESVALGQPVAPAGPIFTSNDRRIVLRIMWYVGLFIVLSVLLWAVETIVWVVVNQEEIVASIARFEEWLFATVDFDRLGELVDSFQRLTDPQSRAELERFMTTLFNEENIAEIESALNMILSPENLRSLEAAIEEAGGADTAALEASLETLLNSENLDALRNALEEATQ